MVQAGGMPAQIIAVDAESVTIDANHRLAGQALTFDVELVSFG
jgi:FKBP-type peptidyl-prolyl cis-trans isomerase 2